MCLLTLNLFTSNKRSRVNRIRGNIPYLPARASLLIQVLKQGKARLKNDDTAYV